MFQTVFPSIIGSSRLCIQQQLVVRYCCLLASGYEMFHLAGARWNIPYPLSIRQQYLFDKCLLLYLHSWTPDGERKDRPKYVKCHSKIKQIWYIGAYIWFYYTNIRGPVDVKNEFFLHYFTLKVAALRPLEKCVVIYQLDKLSHLKVIKSPARAVAQTFCSNIISRLLTVILNIVTPLALKSNCKHFTDCRCPDQQVLPKSKQHYCVIFQKAVIWLKESCYF
jgi:hypothetical protein